MMPTPLPRSVSNSKHGSSRHGSSRHNSSWHGSSRHGSSKHGSMHGSSTHGSSTHGSSWHGSSWHGSSHSELIPIPILRSDPPRVHAASLFSLQVWAFNELRSLIPPLGERVRNLRLFFLGIVAALTIAMVLSHPFRSFVRLFSTLYPPSVRRQHAIFALAAFLASASLALTLAEGWHPVDAAYFVSATISTIGCRDVGPRSLLGKLIASMLSMVGPLAAALFWRSARTTRSVSHQAMGESRGRSELGSTTGSFPLTASEGHDQDLSVEGEEDRESRIAESRIAESRVADTIWAFVGMLMVVITCAGVFLRAANGGDGASADETENGMSGSVVKPTLIDAAYAAFMTIATVGPANPPFSEPSSHGSRAVMIPIMLAGAAIFSRSMWAIVDVLMPPALGPPSSPRIDHRRHRVAAALSGLSSPILNRIKGRGTGGDGGNESLRDSPAVGTWRGIAAAGPPLVYGAKEDTTSAYSAVDNRQEPPPPKQQERGVGMMLKGNGPERMRLESEGGGWGREAVALKAARQPPTPFLPPTTAVVDFDDEEDDGWVSEEEQAIGHDPGNGCVEVDWESRVEGERAAGAGDGPADEIDDVSRRHEQGNDGRQVSVDEDNYHLDDAPRAIRSWQAGSVRRTEPARRQKRSGEGGADGEARDRSSATLGDRGEGDGRDAPEEDITGSNRHGTLESVEEGDEDADDSFRSTSRESGSRQGLWSHRALEQHSGAALEETSPRSVDGFIVKKLLEQGKLGRMEAARMMLEFEQTATRSKNYSTEGGSNGSKGKREDDESSSRPPRTDDPAGALQGSTANASSAAPNSRRGLESLENPPRPLCLEVDALPTQNGNRQASRRRGEGVVTASAAGLSPHVVFSPTCDAPLPPPGL